MAWRSIVSAPVKPATLPWNVLLSRTSAPLPAPEKVMVLAPTAPPLAISSVPAEIVAPDMRPPDNTSA